MRILIAGARPFSPRGRRLRPWHRWSGFPLIRAAGRVTAHDVKKLKERLTLAGDTRDILAARDSMLQLLGFDPLTA
jgi:hypothetical protein